MRERDDIVDGELVEQSIFVGRHCLRAEFQALGNDLRAVALREHHRHFELARGQIGEWRTRTIRTLQCELLGDVAA